MQDDIAIRSTDAKVSATGTLIHDCRRGVVQVPGKGEVALTPDEDAVLFWCTSGAPLERLGQLSGTPVGQLEQLQAGLADKLGLTTDSLASYHLRYADGEAVRPSQPWSKRTMAQCVHDRLAQRNPDEMFLYLAEGGALSVGELFQLVVKVRAAFRAAGVECGNVIAADSSLRLETYVLTLAAWLHGAPIIRLNNNAGREVMRSQLDRTPAKLTFTVRSDDLSDLQSAGRVITLADDLEHTTDGDFETWLSAAPEPVAADETPAAVSPEDLCIISSTSGSTGLPKAVLLSHGAIWFGADRATRLADFSSDDLLCSAGDFIGDMSSHVALHIPLMRPTKVLLPRARSRRSPLDFAMDCVTANVTVAMAVPAALRAIMASGDRIAGPFSRQLRYLMSASAPFGTPLAKAFRARSNAQIIEYMGSREYGGAFLARTNAVRVLSAGGGFENEVLARLVTAEGKLAAPGETGKLLVVSLSTMDGYIRPDDQDANGYASLPERPPGYALWFDSGDLACYNADGGITLLGRSTDLMKGPDGQIVMPIEIENILHADARVKEACVFSVLDPEGFERIGGAVIPKGEIDPSLEPALRALVQEKLGHLRTPVGLMIAGDVPRVAQNKVNKAALKALFIEQKLQSTETQNEFY
ncbi:AMP-binding protein [Roseobacter sp. A03A-229]